MLHKSLAILLTISLAFFAIPAAAEVAVHSPAPHFAGKDTNNNTVKLSDYKGKIVVLEWKNHECPFVRKHYGSGNMQSLQKWAKEKGVVWLSILSSAPGKQGHVSAEEANNIVQKEGAAPTAVILDEDGAIGRLYGAKTTPHMFVIGTDGNLAYMGAIDDKPSPDAEDVKTARNYVKEAVTALLDGKEVEVATSNAYGCGVKY